MTPSNVIISPAFIELPSVDSTNNYATARAHEGMAQHGMAVFAHDQVKGKGQRQKEWKTEKGANITMSVLLTPAGISLSQSFLLSMCVASTVRRFMESYTGGEVKVKWPNDIYWRDRKAGGILIENIVQGQQWKYAVVGMGLNINQTNFGELTNKAVSLKQISGKTYDTVALAKTLQLQLIQSFNRIVEEAKNIETDYLQHLYKLNEKVKLRQGPRLFEAVIKGVTKEGQLIAQTGVEELFTVGEVEWIV